MPFAAIHTERLLLRPVQASDSGAMADRRSDPEVARHQSWTPPYTLEQATKAIEAISSMEEPVDDEWWMLTITKSDDQTVLGDLVIHPTWDGRSVEIGYTLARSAWGNGYATEAVQALIARLFENRQLTRIHAMLHPDNTPSARVLERTGFLYEGRTKLSYWVGDDNSDDLFYGLTRSDWDDWTSRRQDPPASVSLVEITSTNLAEVRKITTHKSQERFVAPIEKSLSTALFPPIIDGAPLVPWLRAVEADGVLVGFVMLSLATDEHPEPCLWRFLVDRKHQGRGIGMRSLELAIAECASLGTDSMSVFWCEGTGTPKGLYLSRGFVPTGTIEDGETEARLVFDQKL